MGGDDLPGAGGLPPASPNGGQARRAVGHEHEWDEDHPHRRQPPDYYRQNNNAGGNGGPGTIVTAAMVSLAVGAIWVVLQYFAITQEQIDRSIAPLDRHLEAIDRKLDGKREEQDAKDDWSELARQLNDIRSAHVILQNTKVDKDSRAEMMRDYERRFETMERAFDLINRRLQSIDGTLQSHAARGRYGGLQGDPEDSVTVLETALVTLWLLVALGLLLHRNGRWPPRRWW